MQCSEISQGQVPGAGIELEAKFYIKGSLKEFKSIRNALIKAYDEGADVIKGLRFSAGPRDRVLSIGDENGLGRERSYVFFDIDGKLERLGIRFSVRDRGRDYQATVKIPVSLVDPEDTIGAVIELNAKLDRKPNGVEGLMEITPSEAIEAILNNSENISVLPKDVTVENLVDKYFSDSRDLPAHEARTLSYKVDTNYFFLETEKGPVSVALDRVTAGHGQEAVEFYEIEIEAKDEEVSPEKMLAAIERAGDLLQSWLKEQLNIDLTLQPKGMSKFKRVRECL